MPFTPAALRSLRDNDEPPTGQVISPPGRLDIGQRDSFGINVQLAAGSQRPHLWKGIEDDTLWNAASASPADLNAGTPQRSRRQTDGGASHFANLNPPHTA
jgi:hypothetical protein